MNFYVYHKIIFFKNYNYNLYNKIYMYFLQFITLFIHNLFNMKKNVIKIYIKINCHLKGVHGGSIKLSEYS